MFPILQTVGLASIPQIGTTSNVRDVSISMVPRPLGDVPTGLALTPCVATLLLGTEGNDK